MYKALFLPTQKIFLLDTFYMLLASLKGGVLNILLLSTQKCILPSNAFLQCTDLFYFNFTKQRIGFTKILSGKLFNILCKFKGKRLCFFFRKKKENFIKIKDKNLQQKYKLELCKNAVFLVYPNILHSKV